MVLEGVHLVPGLIPEESIEGALVVQCVLAIEDEDTHASHFMIRDATSGGVRPVDKYMDRFEEIRSRPVNVALGGGASMEILWPRLHREPFLRETRSDVNANSIVARVAFARTLVGAPLAPTPRRAPGSDAPARGRR